MKLHNLDRDSVVTFGLMKSPTEVSDIILCVENLNPGSRSVSQESDSRDKVWLKANKMKLEKTIRRKDQSRSETIQLILVVILMLVIALTIVIVRS